MAYTTVKSQKLKKKNINKSRNLFKLVLVLLSASFKRVGVSRMLDFLLRLVHFSSWIWEDDQSPNTLRNFSYYKIRLASLSLSSACFKIFYSVEWRGWCKTQKKTSISGEWCLAQNFADKLALFLKWYQIIFYRLVFKRYGLLCNISYFHA